MIPRESAEMSPEMPKRIIKQSLFFIEKENIIKIRKNNHEKEEENNN